MRVGGVIGAVMLLAMAPRAVAAPSGSMTFEGFYLQPLGALSREYSGGAGGYGGVALFFPDRYEMAIKAGYVSYLAAADLPADRSLSALHLMVGPRYYFLTSTLRPYAALNVGLNLVFESTAAGRNHLTAELAWQILLGVALHVAGPVGIDVAAKYNAHFFEQDRMMTGFEYGLALRVETF
ncbi:MAG: hypothetical protein IT384_08955 [Deltaproteobacteria bacterium]|nr:hypothetical protein [Deltaproteobacteria bacterium]